jgi:hypothetical protein
MRVHSFDNSKDYDCNDDAKLSFEIVSKIYEVITSEAIFLFMLVSFYGGTEGLYFKGGG